MSKIFLKFFSAKNISQFSPLLAGLPASSAIIRKSLGLSTNESAVMEELNQ